MLYNFALFPSSLLLIVYVWPLTIKTFCFQTVGISDISLEWKQSRMKCRCRCMNVSMPMYEHQTLACSYIGMSIYGGGCRQIGTIIRSLKTFCFQMVGRWMIWYIVGMKTVPFRWWPTCPCPEVSNSTISEVSVVTSLRPRVS